jgi:hypothetical protein
MMTGSPPFPGESLVTLANWQDPPFNRWAFQHVRELIPTARITRGSGPARRLPRAERDLADVRFSFGAHEPSVAQMLAETYADGFLVLHDGVVVTEQYFNGMAPDVPHLLMSVSKSVTSAVAGVLTGRALLDVSAQVEQIIPELGDTSFRGATVQDLLDMRAGTRFDENYDNPDADVRTYERVYMWRPADGQPVPQDALAYLCDTAERRPAWRPVPVPLHPDRRAGLGARAGQRHAAARPHRPRTVAADGCRVRCGDHRRFPRQSDGGWWHLPGAWIDDTIRGAADGASAFASGDDPPGYLPVSHYRNCWRIRDPGLPFYHASGIYGQDVFIHVAAQTVAVKLSTWPTPLSTRMHEMTISGVTAIADSLRADHG